MFKLTAQNMDINVGRLLHRKTELPIPWSFDPIPPTELANTLVVFIGDNGSQGATAREEPKKEIYEYSVRISMIIADGPGRARQACGLSGLALEARLVAIGCRFPWRTPR